MMEREITSSKMLCHHDQPHNCNNNNKNHTYSLSTNSADDETGGSQTTTMPCYWSNYYFRKRRNRIRIEGMLKPEVEVDGVDIYLLHVGNNSLKNKRIIREIECKVKNSSFSINSLLFSLFLLLVIPSQFLSSQPQQTSRNLILSSSSTSESPIPKSVFASAASATGAGGGSFSKINAAFKQPKPNSIQNINLANNNNIDTNNSTNVQTSTPSNATSAEFLLNLVKSNFNQQLGGPNGTRVSGKSRPGQQRERMHYQTNYACEGNQLDIGCQEGKLIHLVRANYGRFSVSICNEFGHSNLSVQCYSFRAFLLMETKCNNLSNCSVIVSKDLFGDPCEGTSKYLEVQYYCDDANNNQQIPSQPQVSPNNRIAGQPALDQTGTNKEPASGSGAAPSGHKSPAATQAAGGQEVEQQQQPAAAAAARDEQQPTIGGDQSGTMSVIQQQQQHHHQQRTYCLPQSSARNVFWNYTRAGHLARQNCPDGSSGMASWLCDSELLRFTPGWSADFTQCRSNWLQRLGQQLDQQMQLLAKQPASSMEPWQRLQNEHQSLRVILNDLALMASTKELFSEDLKKIDSMISQIIAQLKLFSSSLLYGSQAGSAGAGSSWRSANNAAGLPAAAAGNLGPLYEELFNKLVGIVSSLFDGSQRSAWLDIQPAELRRKLEQHYLNHLKDSGLMLAHALGPAALEQQQPLRQANVFAAITVINNARLNSPSAPIDPESNEFNLQLKQSQQTILTANRFVTEPDDQMSEFRINMSILRELIANGITRFLVLDIRKPDYSLIRHQLESSYAYGAATSDSSMENSLPGDQQWSSRVFALSASPADLQQQQQQQVPNALGQQDLPWPPPLPPPIGHHPQLDQFDFSSPAASSGGSQQQQQQSRSLEPSLQPTYAGPQQQDKQQPPSIWTIIFIVLGLSVFVVSLASFAINAVVRASSQCRLNKEPGFLSTGTSILGHNHHQQGGPTTGPLADHSLMSGEPLTVGAAAAAATAPTSASTTTQSSGSIIGLSNSSTNTTTCHAYKTHQQQLYAAPHYPALDGGCVTGGLTNRWAAAWRRWLRPSRWLGAANPSKGMEHISGCGGGGGLQHRIVGHPNLANQSHSSAYKSHFQNGYTTGLPHHRHHQSPVVGAAAAAAVAAGHPQHLAAPSSVSSYVSSSAYYEEIGPGNLTKVGTSQLASSNAHHTIVDPFKGPNQPAAHEQQQLLAASSGHLTPQRPAAHHPLQQAWQQQQSYPQQAQDGQHQLLTNNYGPTIISSGAQNQLDNKHHLTQLHSDLSQLQQSSSSSAGSQHSSASTSVTTANGSAPRHYLFASPSAVSAYKSSMGQQNHLHQQQQNLHHLQQQHFHQQQQRFMPSR